AGRGCRHALVERLHRDRRDPLGQCRNVLDRRLGCRTDLTRKAAWQPDDHLDHVPFGHQVSDRVNVARTPGQRGQRSGEQTVRVAGCYPDPDGTDVDAQPHAANRAGVITAHADPVARSVTNASAALTASFIPAGSVPPPWARSALPPPRPLTAGASA